MDWDILFEDWDNQPDWGPRYSGWWEVCSKCEGFYNWFNLELTGGLRMAGWVHLEGFCLDGERFIQEKAMTWTDTRGMKSED